MNNKRSLQRALSIYAIIYTTVSALFFTFLVMIYSEENVTTVLDSILVIEARTFEKEYLDNPKLEPSDSNTVKLILGSWENHPFYASIFPTFSKLEAGEVLDVNWPPYQTNSLSDAPLESNRIITLYTHQLHDGKKLVVISDIELALLSEEETEIFDQYILEMFYVSISYAALTFIVFFLISRRILKQTSALATWVENLRVDNLKKVTPSFHFKEFSLIAAKMKLSVEKIAELVKKEHQFLQNVSHELRTPISVIHANMALLKRIGYPAENDIMLHRIDRANNTMQLLTETILWLNRNSEKSPNTQKVDLKRLINGLIEDLQYLLKHKDVELQLQFHVDDDHPVLCITPLLIVFNNLIRNAFQHTEYGEVTIICEKQRLIIENKCPSINYAGTEEHFGLGILLVQQICQKLNWQCTINESEFGFCVELAFH